MAWYYATAQKQEGPVEQREFDQLIRHGVITGNTLVWREGMAEWQPYDKVAAEQGAAVGDAGGALRGAQCSECGGWFPPDEVVRLGNRRLCGGCKPIAVQRLREGVADTGPEAIRQAHLRHEASIRSVGVLYYLGGGVLLLAGIARPLAQPDAVGVALAIVFVGLGALQIWAGAGLRRLKDSARTAAGVLSGLGLLGFPLGTLINAYILYLLFSKKGSMVFSPAYQRIIQATPHLRYRTSAIAWVVLGLLVALFAFALLPILMSNW